MKLTVVLAVLIGTIVLACSTAAPAPVEPTPNIDATVEAKLAQERAVDSTVEARLKEERASQPTSIPSPTNTQAPSPTNTPTLVPSPTSVPTATPRPLPTATPIPTNAHVSSSCEGKTIRFKIGSVWANESIVWEQGGGTEINLTASTTSLPSKHITSWPISVPAQRVRSHVVVGSVNAADGTSISAWNGDTQIATTSVAGGSYSLIIDKEECVSTSVSTGTSSKVAPPTKFEGGFVMFLGQDFKITGEIAFKIGQYVAEQTATLHSFGAGEMQLLDLYATSMDSEVPYTAQTGYERGTSPPNVIAGRAYIDGEYAPDGTVVTAWIGGEEIVEFRTTIENIPTPLAEPKLLSILDTEIPPPSPLPTPCPSYMDCGLPPYSGRLADNIKAIWQYDSDDSKWWFYSPDPIWELAHNLPPDICNYFETDPYRIPFGGSYGMHNHPDSLEYTWEFTEICGFGHWYNMKNEVVIDPPTVGGYGGIAYLSPGWNLHGWLNWEVDR